MISYSSNLGIFWDFLIKVDDLGNSDADLANEGSNSLIIELELQLFEAKDD